MSDQRKSQLLVIYAILASLALVGSYLLAGGSSYAPAEVQDPCEERPWRDPDSLEQIAEQFSLSALDGAACELGVTRERLARALATPESRDRFMERYGIDEMRLAQAVRAGLLRAVDDAEEAGAISPLVGVPLREGLKRIPLDEAIELIQDASTLLDNLQGFFGPAQDLIEEFLP